MLDHPGPGVGAKGGPGLRVQRRELEDSIREGGRVHRRYGPPGVPDEFGGGAHLGDGARNPACHGLTNRVREPLAHRREARDVEGREASVIFKLTLAVTSDSDVAAPAVRQPSAQTESSSGVPPSSAAVGEPIAVDGPKIAISGSAEPRGGFAGSSLGGAALDDRQSARANKDFASADAIRDRLLAAGIAIEDTAEGSRWTLAKDAE